MFERYTEKARRVIFFARYEASQFGSPYIETEHLLLGLLREDKALTNRFLRSHASVESIRKQIEGHTTIREKVSTSVDLPLSNECKRVLAYAAEEAERLSHKHIGTEHLLLGLLREEKCFAAEILHERGLRLSAIREELARSTQEKATPPRQGPFGIMSSREYPDRPIVGVGAVIVDQGSQRVVLVRRAAPPLQGQWSLPGGVLELGETLRTAVEREALEETGLVVKAGEVLEVLDRIIPGAGGKTQFHYVLVDFVCQLRGGELRAGGDAAEVAWAGKDELARFRLEAPAMQVIMKAFSRPNG
jgi:ADP-ribose pyrophosphatase YjhB (NUDIX family)